MRSHRLRPVALLVLASLSFAGVAPAGQVRVNVTNFDFTPRAVNVNPGDQVVWVWIAGTHTVTSGDSTFGVPANGIFSSGSLGSGQWSWKSTAPGTYIYYCVPHRPSMAGRVIVGATVPVSDFRITEVYYSEAGGLDKIEISNVGNAAGNLGRYRVVVGATVLQIAQNDLAVAAAGQPGSIITVHTNQAGVNDASNVYLPVFGNLPTTGSAALYVPNSTGSGAALTNASMMIDYVQWGAGGQPNEATAATAGLWTTGQFVPTVAVGHSIELCNTVTRNASSWSEVSTPNVGTDGDCLTPTNTTTWGRIKSIYR